MSHTELFVVVKTRGILDIVVGKNKKRRSHYHTLCKRGLTWPDHPSILLPLPAVLTHAFGPNAARSRLSIGEEDTNKYAGGLIFINWASTYHAAMRFYSSRTKALTAIYSCMSEHT